MNITAPQFTNEAAARQHLEALRWPNGPFCPHCGSVNATRLPAVRGRKTKANPEGALRAGVVQCNDCRDQYSVTVGTVFERSKVPLHKWLLATHLLCSSKKGMSAHQLHRMLGVTYKTAWFMFHRIREAMRNDDTTPFGGAGEVVEVDETFIGRKAGMPIRRAYHHKMKVLALVDRATGQSRAMVVNDIHKETIMPIVRVNVLRETTLMTDDGMPYRGIRGDFAGHNVVAHTKGEYSRGGGIHTNTVEGYFSIFKRGMKGIYQHCAEKHLHRYLAEFDFRYCNRSANGVEDQERASMALRGIYGRRLTYRRIGAVAA
jgi:transposase-like protein